MKKVLLTGVVVLCMIGFAMQLATQNVKHRPSDLPLDITDAVVEAAASDAFASTNAPGMVVTMYRGPIEQPAVALALGHADVDERRPIGIDDRFRIGDLSMSLLGYVALVLHNEERLDLNAPLSTYLPDVPNGDAITVAMLGYHTSGLPDAAQSPALQEAVAQDPTKIWTSDALLTYATAPGAAGVPGETWAYSRTNGLYLARVIEQATGDAWTNVLQRSLLQPLGMDSTRVSVDEPLPDSSLNGYHYAAPNAPFQVGSTLMETTAWNASWMGIGTSMSSTARDLATFARTAGNAGLIDREARKLLRRWRETDAPYFEHGFMVWDYFGALVMVGEEHGFSSFATYLPDLDATVVVLANLSRTQDGSNPARNVGIGLIDVLYGIR